MTTNLAKMERRIAGLISTFQCISTLAEKSSTSTPQNTSKTLAITRLELLETNWGRFQREHDALLDMNCENLAETAYFKEKIESQCQLAYEGAKVSLLTIKEYYEQVEPTGANLADLSAIPGASTRRSALPKIKIPDFDGEFHSWRSFHDLFVSLVGQNQDITSVEKMHYLRLSLKGDAAQLISNLPVSSDSFIAAWDLLVSRYENKRLLVTSQLDRFFGMTHITLRSHKSINQLINTTSEVLNALKALEMPVDDWGVLLVHFIASRLDHHLREQWELALGSSTTPATLQQLRDFLTTRARALESMDAGKASSLNRPQSGTAQPSARTSKGAPPAKAMAARTTAPADDANRAAIVAAAIAATEPLRPAGAATQSCHFCLGQHFITKCPLFRQKTPKERRVVAEQRKLCFNCLGPHSANNCRVTGRCFECNGKHHTLIHVPSINNATTASPSPKPNTSTSKPVATSSPTEGQN